MKEIFKPKNLVGYILWNNDTGSVEYGVCVSIDELNKEIEDLEDVSALPRVEILSVFSTGKFVVNKNVIIEQP